MNEEDLRCDCDTGQEARKKSFKDLETRPQGAKCTKYDNSRYERTTKTI